MTQVSFYCGLLLPIFLWACDGTEDVKDAVDRRAHVIYRLDTLDVNGVEKSGQERDLYEISIDYENPDPILEIRRSDKFTQPPNFSYGEITLVEEATRSEGADVAYKGKNARLSVEVTGRRNENANWMSRFALQATGEAGLDLTATAVIPVD